MNYHNFFYAHGQSGSDKVKTYQYLGTCIKNLERKNQLLPKEIIQMVPNLFPIGDIASEKTGRGLKFVFMGENVFKLLRWVFLHCLAKFQHIGFYSCQSGIQIKQIYIYPLFFHARIGFG
jgi:hypothetical protein